MKKFTFLKTTLVALSLAFLGACSSSQYTFAPGTSSYHDVVAKKITSQSEVLAETSAETSAPALELAAPQAEAATALMQNLKSKATVAIPTTGNAVTLKSNVAEKNAARQEIKLLKKDLKLLKKDIKKEKASGINSTVKLLLLLGLIFLLLGVLAPVLGLIGLILIIIGLVLLLMELL